MNSCLNRIDNSQAASILAKIDCYYDELPTHFVVHDLGRMRGRIGKLIDAFPRSFMHAVAIKANPVVEVLRATVLSGAGLEAGSMEEVHLAIAAGCEPQNIVFDSPAKTIREIEEALRIGVLLNANSFEELRRIDLCLRNVTSDSAIGLRVNPEVGSGKIAHTSVANVGGKFGVSVSKQDEIIDAFAMYSWLTGLHCHVGSQGCDCSKLIRGVERLVEVAEKISDALGHEIEFIDIGGGLPTTYAEEQSAPTFDVYANDLKHHLPQLFDGRFRVITEFGRAIQAGCGVAYSRVEYVADSSSEKDEQMAIVHFGADFLLRPVYRPNEWKHEFFVFGQNGQIKSPPEKPTTIAGPLCFGGDVIGKDVILPEIHANDWLCIRDVGAYTLSMWSRHCNRGLPPVIGIDGDEVTLLFSGESAADVARFWSECHVGTPKSFAQLNA